MLSPASTFANLQIRDSAICLIDFTYNIYGWPNLLTAYLNKDLFPTDKHTYTLQYLFITNLSHSRMRNAFSVRKLF